jgi:phosphoribosylanthranilate isomerase
MPVEVKICGLKTPDMMAACLDAGADYVGLVFFPRSPRDVSLADAATLAGPARGRSKIVALAVDADDALIDDIARLVRPDFIQVHGAETVERVRAVKARTGLKVIKAIKVGTPADAAAALEFAGAADLILFDAKAPQPAKNDGSMPLPGGNGHAFDWRMLDGVKDQVRYMLSGGLHPGNVREAVRRTGTRAVDVSSGVELAPGEKSAALIRSFIQAAKAGLDQSV